MKIYFAGSIRGGREDAAMYLEIIEYLKTFGEVLTEHIGDPNHLPIKAMMVRLTGSFTIVILEWLQSADVLIAEVTTTSMGVGYEIGRAS